VSYHCLYRQLRQRIDSGDGGSGSGGGGGGGGGLSETQQLAAFCVQSAVHNHSRHLGIADIPGAFIAHVNLGELSCYVRLSVCLTLQHIHVVSLTLIHTRRIHRTREPR
jgi:hypothetical protein